MDEHPNVALLRTLYSDLTRIGEYVTDDVAYHLAEGGNETAAPVMTGKQAAIARERAFVAATHGTLTADIDWIGANDHFGTVMGTFRTPASSPPGRNLAMPFCGLWRFGPDGLITHHWQNAYDPDVLVRFMAGAQEAS